MTKKVKESFNEITTMDTRTEYTTNFINKILECLDEVIREGSYL